MDIARFNMRRISLFILIFVLMFLMGCTKRIDDFNKMIKDIEVEKSVLMISDTSIYDSNAINLINLVEKCLDDYGRNIQVYTDNQVLIKNDLYILTPFKVSRHTINALVKIDIITKETTLIYEFEAIDYTVYGNYIHLYQNVDALYIYRSDHHQIIKVVENDVSMHKLDSVQLYHQAKIIDNIFFRYKTNDGDLITYDAYSITDFSKVNQLMDKADLGNPIVTKIGLDTYEIRIDNSRKSSFDIIKNGVDTETITLEMLLKTSYAGVQIWDAIEKTELSGILFQMPLETKNGFIIGFKFQNGFLFNKSLNGETNFFIFEYTVLSKESIYLGQSKNPVQHVLARLD
jgi:hypothetical protein